MPNSSWDFSYSLAQELIPILSKEKETDQKKLKTTARGENMCRSQQDRQMGPLPLICKELRQINKKKVTRQQRHGIPMRTTMGPVYLGSDA